MKQIATSSQTGNAQHSTLLEDVNISACLLGENNPLCPLIGTILLPLDIGIAAHCWI